MKYTTETRLYIKNNKNIVKYFDEVKEQYSYIMRKVYYIIRNNPKIKTNLLSTKLQNEHSISKRTANSIIKTVQGRINSIKELKKTEIKQKQYKLEKISEKLEKLIPVLANLKLEAERNDIKDLVIEDLNFLKTKSKATKGKSKKGKKYNKMIHSLAYKIFLSRTEQICNKKNVGLIKVNPAWTSWIAKNKFCEKMKLNIHIGASFVIARRGMNIKDVV